LPRSTPEQGSLFGVDKADGGAISDFKELLRKLLSGYEFDIAGLYTKKGELRPLPRESAVVGKVIEGSILEYLYRRLLAHKTLVVLGAKSSRSYPDLTFRRSQDHPETFAVDIKCARRESGKRIQSAIAIGTYDAEYFHYPNTPASNIEAPYGSYTAHLALIALYDYKDTTADNVELLIVEKWRIAKRSEASGTRSYIATSTLIEDLRAERGDFKSEDEFNKFWRAKPVKPSKLKKWKEKHPES